MKMVKVKIVNNVMKGKTYHQLVVGSVRELPESTARGWFINGLAIPFHKDIVEEVETVSKEKGTYKPEMTKKGRKPRQKSVK